MFIVSSLIFECVVDRLKSDLLGLHYMCRHIKEP